MKIDEIKIGDTASFSKVISEENVNDFARISGDVNPIHLDSEYAKNTIFKERIAHGILVSSLISSVIANQLPGEGSIYLSQSLKFIKPVKIGEIITAEVSVINIEYEKNRVVLSTKCFNENKNEVIIGEALVMLPK